MGKICRPARSFALALALAAPSVSYGQQEEPEPAAEVERQGKPLRHIEINSRREEPDTLDGESLARYRGTGNGDVFSQIPGVQLNNIRNEAGAIDVGIRGLQGEGRAPVVIDGALQSTHTFRGYQGESDRTYIDMDLVRSVSVTKGPSISGGSAGAIAGQVNMRTIAAGDVVLPGRSFGMWVKGSRYNNNRSPEIPEKERDQNYYVLTNSQPQGSFDNGAISAALAYQADGLEWLLAHSRRRVGNYFAGRAGMDRYEKDAVVSPGQEVVNTSYESDSSIAKLGWRAGTAGQVELVYRHHEQRAGEVLLAYWYKSRNDQFFQPWPEGVQSMPQWSLGSTRLDSYSGSYHYAPADNALVDLRLGLWKTDVAMTQHNGLFSGPRGAGFGDQYLHEYADQRQGLNLGNRSRLAGWPLAFDYGMSLEEQRTEPVNFRPRGRRRPSSRDARRSEYAFSASAEAELGTAFFKLGARQHGAQVSDYEAARRIRYRPRTDLMAEGRLGLLDGLELQAKAAQAYRNPSLFESSTSRQTFNYDPLHPLSPERNRSWELALQAKVSDLFARGAGATARVGYFSNSVRGYISSAELPLPPDAEPWQYNFSFRNYDKVELKGWEAKLAYDHPRFFADASAVLYDRPVICSKAEAEELGAPECNSQGYAWSIMSTRIPPRRSFSLGAGVRALERRVVLGARLKYHSGKTNPVDWFQGTAARAVVAIPSEKIVDLFASFKLGPHAALDINIDNLTNRYAFDPGTVIAMPRPGRTVRVSLEGRF